MLEDGAEQEIFTFERQTDLPLSLAVLDRRERLSASHAACREGGGQIIHKLNHPPYKDQAAVVSLRDATLEQI